MSAKLVLVKFRLGHIVTTPNALTELSEEDILCGIQRHQAGDWGDLGSDDKEANDQALVNHKRILSAYRAENGTRFWIITEHDRRSTCILLPEDY